MFSDHLSELAKSAQGDYKDIVFYFGKADDAIKTILSDYPINKTNFIINVDLAKNEIRFAGNHLVRAVFYSSSLEEYQDNYDCQIREAIKHCKLAIVLCFEYGIRDKINRFDLYEKIYPVTIKDSIDAYSDDLKNKMEAEHLLQKTGSKTDKCHSQYEDFEKYYYSLRDSIFKIKGAEKELQKRTNDRKNKHRLVITTLMVSFLAAGAGYLNFFFKQMPNP